MIRESTAGACGSGPSGVSTRCPDDRGSTESPIPNPRSRPSRLVALASGRGSNLRAILDASRRGDLPVEVVGVLSDKAEAPALAIARAEGIGAEVLDPRTYPTRAAFDEALFARIAAFAPDLVVLAGYMRIIDAAALAPWVGRVLNIHPSLLPKYPGLHTHRRAIEAGDREHGASVHYVTAELDGGPVIAQSRLAIEAGDTPETLAERLLPLEHRLYVGVIALAASGRLDWHDGMPRLDGKPLAEPLRHDGQSTFIDLPAQSRAPRPE